MTAYGTLTCRTTYENACPSFDDCYALKLKANEAKDDSLAVGFARPSPKDGELRAPKERETEVLAQYGTGRRYFPGQDKYLAADYRRANVDVPSDKVDSLCVNRVQCDTPTQRAAEAQVACPPSGREQVDGIW